MNRLIAIFSLLVFMFSTSFCFAASKDRGYDFGSLDKEGKKAQIEADKSAKQAQKDADKKKKELEAKKNQAKKDLGKQKKDMEGMLKQ